ncbi:MAG: mechanosensitive ion channel, partial [Treponema sp.]|nr:mechanosensitive ion channel [Treponema sp.]
MQSIINFWTDSKNSLFDIGMDVLVSVLVILICLFISKGFNKLINKAINKKNVNETALSVIHHIVSYSVFIICIIIILNIFGVNTTSLIALLGAAGLAVGLALKDTLGNIASGISLFLLGSYRHGEFIEFGSYSGTVKDINLFTTILETFDGIYISAPNSSIWGVPIKNYTRNGKRRMELPVRISYSESIDNVYDILNRIIITEQRFLEEPPPQIIVQSLNESHI